MANAIWWVRYTDQHGREGMLSLSSPDMADPKKAHKRARDTAKARLAKRSIKATGLSSKCVG